MKRCSICRQPMQFCERDHVVGDRIEFRIYWVCEECDKHRVVKEKKK